MSSAPAIETSPPSATGSFLAGWRSAWTSVFALVLLGTYVGVGALAHNYGFSLTWVLLSTVLVWAGPAQVILLSALGGGASPLEAGIAVALSGIRLLPMVVVLLALIKRPGTKMRELFWPAHLTAASMWVESLRLLPGLPSEQRIPFANGLGTGYMAGAVVGTVVGFYLAYSLPGIFTAALLFLTPMSFLVSTARNSKLLSDRIALALGLVIGPIFVYEQVELDLLWTGIVAGSAAYGIHRLRETLR